MVLIVVAVVYALWWVARRRRWPGTAGLARWLAATWPKVRAYVRASPATFTYLFILAVTTWVVVGSSPTVVDLLKGENSTNLYHLGQDPLRVLIRSAFWLDSYELLLWAVLFSVVLAPAERWLGTARWVAVFAAGHVGATLVVATGLWWAIRWGWVSAGERFAVDVGASYGFLAVAALFTYRWSGRVARWWACLLVGIVVAGLVIGRSFTDAGHLVALLIGFSLYPLTRASTVQARRSGPVWRVSAAGSTVPPSPFVSLRGGCDDTEGGPGHDDGGGVQAVAVRRSRHVVRRRKGP